jgi:hypothetical protein
VDGQRPPAGSVPAGRGLTKSRFAENWDLSRSGRHPGSRVGAVRHRKESEMVCLNTNVNRPAPAARMSPAQFAKDECANALANGGCLGVSVDSLVDRGQVKTCTPRSRCRVAEGQRCEYFERAVLPLADKPSPASDRMLQQKRAWARQEYLGSHLLRDRAGGRCPECGNPKPRRHRFCETCSGRRRREAGRRRVQRHRQTLVSV